MVFLHLAIALVDHIFLLVQLSLVLLKLHVEVVDLASLIFQSRVLLGNVFIQVLQILEHDGIGTREHVGILREPHWIILDLEHLVMQLADLIQLVVILLLQRRDALRLVAKMPLLVLDQGFALVHVVFQRLSLVIQPFQFWRNLVPCLLLLLLDLHQLVRFLMVQIIVLERQHIDLMLEDLVLRLSLLQIRVQLLCSFLCIRLLVDRVLQCLLLIGQLRLQLLRLLPQHLMVLERLHDSIVQSLELFLIQIALLLRYLALLEQIRQHVQSNAALQILYLIRHFSHSPIKTVI